MEKEKKKLLMVAVSSGVFLVIVISAAILIFTPKVSAERDAAASPLKPVPAGSGWTEEAAKPAAVDILDTAKTLENAGGIQTQTAASAVQETTFYIRGENPSGYKTPEKNESGVPAKTVITVPRPSTAAVPDTPVEAPQSAPQAAPRPAPAVAKAPAAAKPAAASKPAEKAAAKTAARPAASKPAAAKPVPAKSAVAPVRNDYWVQTGAFTAKVRAEGVKETLASKGIASIIENREADGKIWYRVRVGPYTSEKEASYWLTLVRSIDGFADSQIRQTRRTP